jgi:beta-glucosidase
LFPENRIINPVYMNVVSVKITCTLANHRNWLSDSAEKLRFALVISGLSKECVEQGYIGLTSNSQQKMIFQEKTMEDSSGKKFPDGFIWGAATAAYQIEGAVSEDGRGPSIWDTFAHMPGKVERNETGDIASDFYHRWPQDLDLMVELGLKAYRFSISWSRILPLGVGQVNMKGLDFYDRLVDGLLERGISPYVTLYHWDLPQALQDRGGWGERDTALAFADYAAIVADRLGDRVRHWITLNEPMIAVMVGHFLGLHAPGLQDPLLVGRVGLNLMLAHGMAVGTLRARLPDRAKIGITLNLSPVYPASESEADLAAAKRFDLFTNRLFLDPIMTGSFPEEISRIAGILAPRPTVEDLQIIAIPLDFLGVNYYSRNVIRQDGGMPLVNANQIHPVGNEYSQMWEIYPPGLFETVNRVWRDYLQLYHPEMRILITENGVPVPDGVDFDGRVRDERRIRYLRQHLEQVWKLIQQGIPLDGYFCWSLLDNFEWAYGYRMRFGLIYVNFENQERIIKDSGRWYARLIHSNQIDQ